MVPHEEDQEHTGHKQDERIELVPLRKHERCGLHALREFHERDDRTGERDSTDEDAQEHLGGVDRGERPLVLGTGLEEGVVAHEYGGDADETVQHRDEFGHAGHLNRPCTPRTDHTADRHCNDGEAECDGQRSLALEYFGVPRCKDKRRRQGETHA